MSAPNSDKKDDAKPSIIVIRRVKKVVHGGHHGGSWKIAYADFVTAMMTFFMLMWLLSMLNKAQLEGISEYFKSPNKKASQQAVETKVKTENALSVKESAGMNSNSEQQKETKTKTKDQTEKEKKKEDEKSKLMTMALKNDIEKQLQTNPQLAEFKNMLNVKITSEGLKIELRDLKDKPMFSKGQTDFAKYAKALMDWLAPTLNKYPNRVMIVGHTDATPLNRADYSNWELSSDRAAATRRALVDSGMDDRKIVRIVGVADTDTLDNTHPTDDANRRIALIVLTDKAYQQMKDE